MNVAHTIPDLETWHWCLGHVNYDSIIQMAEKRLVKGMPTSLAYLLQICEDCILSKQTWMPVPKLQEGGRAKEVLEKFFSDITRPEAVKTPHGELYTLNFIDDYSQKCWVYTLKWKSEAFDWFKDWKELVERETKRKVQIFHTDNGGEYSSKEFEGYLRHQGINHQVTAPYTSAQNGKAKHLTQLYSTGDEQ